MIVGVGGWRGRRKEGRKLERTKSDRSRDIFSYITEGEEFRHPRSSL